MEQKLTEEQKQALEKAREESVWAEGVPAQIKPEDYIPAQELLAMAVDYIVKRYAIPHGFKIDQAVAEPGKLPNIIMKKDGVMYAIAVVPCVYPNYAVLKEELRVSFYNAAKENNAIALVGPVAYKSVDDKRAEAGLALKGDVFQTAFNGFIQLNGDPKQNMFFQPDELVRP